MRWRHFESLTADVLTFTRSLLTLNGALQLLAVGFAVSVLRWALFWLPPLAIVCATGVFAAFFFLVLREASRGAMGLPWMQGSGDPFSDIFAAFGRMLMVTAVVWAPALAYIHWTDGIDAFFLHPGSVLRQPVPLALIAFGIVYLPGALMTAAVTESGVAALNPFGVFTVIRRIPKDYAVAVGLVVGLGVVDVLVAAILAGFAAVLAVPVLTTLVVSTLGLVVPAVLAFALGRIIYRNGVVLEYITRQEMLEPEVPDAEPAGTLSHTTQAGDREDDPYADGIPLDEESE